MKSNVACVLAVVMITLTVRAQNSPPRDFNPEKLADEIFPAQDLDLNYEEGYENLLQLLSQRIDLNRASDEQLRSLFVLREEQVQALLRYRKDTGPFLSVYELQAIPGFDLATCYKLAILVTVSDASTTINRALLRRVISEKNSYVIMRYDNSMERKKGFQPESDSAHRYLGSPGRMYLRFRRSRPGDFSIGFTAEKDDGEAVTWNPRIRYYGMDYYSFHAQLSNKGKLVNLVVGDYQAQFGQGLVLGGGFGMGKGSETVTTVRRSNLGFSPYASINESGFFRGFAVSYRLSKSLTLHAFGSSLNRDAILHSDSAQDESSLVSSFALSGYHRTADELASRKQITEKNFGTVLSYRIKAMEAGLIAHQTIYGLPLIRTPAIYNRFYFSGLRNTNVSGYFNFTLNNLCFFSEVAKTVFHGTGMTIGALTSATSRLDLSILYRTFSRDFYSFYSNAVSENTAPQNESGFYWGLKFVLSRKYSASGYVDLFRFPWLRYRGYAPSDGSEWLGRLNYQPSKRVLVYVQIREESKIRNLTSDGPIYQTGMGRKRNFWLSCDYALPSRWSFKTRAQWNTYTLGGSISRGVVFYQDVSFEAGRFAISGRFALFDADNYDNRIYAYERDVALAFSFPAYEGTGVRRYLMVQYRIAKWADVWVRWALTRYSDRQVIGTGGETIAGNEKNDIKLQFKISL